MQRSVFWGVEGNGCVERVYFFVAKMSKSSLASEDVGLPSKELQSGGKLGFFFFSFRKMLVTNPHVSALGNCSIFV